MITLLTILFLMILNAYWKAGISPFVFLIVALISFSVELLWIVTQARTK